MMLTEICAELKNYFSLDGDRLIGDFEIVDGKIAPSVSIQDNQFYRIVGSIFNDGVHASTDDLIDEEKFHGAVWLMRVPPDVVQLANEIEEWQTKNADVLASPYQSESFGGYSYSKASGGSNGGSSTDYGWKNAFASRLNRYRKISAI